MPLIYVNPILITATSSEVDTLDVSGTTTLGDSPNDNIVINASIISIPNTININNNNLFINNSNNRVGINTGSPSQSLHVNGNTVISGSLGIGNISPAYKLHITNISSQGLSSPFGIQDSGLLAYYPNLADKNLNMAISPNDKGLIFSGETLNSGNFYIGVASDINGGSGIKMNSSGVSIYGLTNILNNIVLGTNNTNTLTINALTVSVPNNLNIGGNALFVDNQNKRIGINTVSPSAPMDINADTNAFGLGLRGRADDNISIIKFKNNDNTHMLRLASGSGLLYVQNGAGSTNIATFDTVNNRTSMTRLNLNELSTNSTDSITFTQGGTSNLLSPSYVGEFRIFRTRRVASRAFPYWNLSSPDQNLSANSYPDYVSYLRNIKIETPSITSLNGNVSTAGNSTTITFVNTQTLTPGTLLYFHTLGQFRTIISGSGLSYIVDEPITLAAQMVSVVSNSSVSSVFTGSWSGTAFTLADNAQNRILLDALSEDAYYQGASFSSNLITPINNTNWMILMWGTTNINIVSFNPVTRVINIASGAPTGTTVEFYPHRIVGSLDARHKQISDTVFINNGMQVINGLRVRDRLQGHRHVSTGSFTASGSGGNMFQYTGSAQTQTNDSGFISGPFSDSINGAPRAGQFTRPRGLGIYYYEYMGIVNI